MRPDRAAAPIGTPCIVFNGSTAVVEAIVQGKAHALRPAVFGGRIPCLDIAGGIIVNPEVVLCVDLAVVVLVNVVDDQFLTDGGLLGGDADRRSRRAIDNRARIGSTRLPAVLALGQLDVNVLFVVSGRHIGVRQFLEDGRVIVFSQGGLCDGDRFGQGLVAPDVLTGIPDAVVVLIVVADDGADADGTSLRRPFAVGDMAVNGIVNSILSDGFAGGVRRRILVGQTAIIDAFNRRDRTEVAIRDFSRTADEVRDVTSIRAFGFDCIGLEPPDADFVDHDDGVIVVISEDLADLRCREVIATGNLGRARALFRGCRDRLEGLGGDEFAVNIQLHLLGDGVVHTGHEVPIRLIDDNRQRRIGLDLADLSTGMSLEARERIDFAVLDRVTNRVVPRGVGIIDLLIVLVAAVAVAAADQIDRVFRAGNDIRVAEASFNRP